MLFDTFNPQLNQTKTMSLAEDCREAVTRYPHIQDSLRLGIVNYRALARHLKPEIKEMRSKEPDIEAVTTALRRYGKNLQQGSEKIQEVKQVLSESRVSLQGNVVSITATEIQTESPTKGFYHLVRGRNYTTIVTDDRNLPEIKNNIEGEIVEERHDLTGITVESPEEIAEVPGVLSRLVSRYMSEDINIVDITSCYTETIIVVQKTDSVKALEVIEEVIEASQNT